MIGTVAVTGASGFCGSHVSRALHEGGYEVISVGRRPGPIGRHRHWDASTDTPPDLDGVDAVVHLAAAVGDFYSAKANRKFEAVNIRGAERLLQAAPGRRIVWVSSSSVYDARLDRAFVAETHPTDGGHLNAYGRSKAVGDKLAQRAGAVVLRPRAVYGPGDRVLLPRLLGAISGRVLPLPGRDVRLSLTHVSNLASACVDALRWPAGSYNVADAESYFRDQAVEAVVNAVANKRVKVAHMPMPVMRALLAAGRLGRILGIRTNLTPYAVDQLSKSFVLDIGKARATGWAPVENLDSYVRGSRQVAGRKVAI